jgi:glutathione peroxidase-family protein
LNFNKFVIDKRGEIVARFGSKVQPQDDCVASAVEPAISNPSA